MKHRQSKEYKVRKKPYGAVSKRAEEYVEAIDELLEWMEEDKERDPGSWTHSEGEAVYNINFAKECLLGYYEWNATGSVF